MWQYIDRCRCVIPIFAFTDVQLRRTNQTICAGQTAEDGRFPTSPMDRRDGLRTLLCLLRTEDTEIKPCSCPLPCDESMYDVAVSTSGPWPHKSYRMVFFDQFVRGNRQGERLNRFANEKVTLSSSSSWSLLAQNIFSFYENWYEFSLWYDTTQTPSFRSKTEGKPS